jgi:hypothetical protein
MVRQENTAAPYAAEHSELQQQLHSGVLRHEHPIAPDRELTWRSKAKTTEPPHTSRTSRRKRTCKVRDACILEGGHGIDFIPMISSRSHTWHLAR